MVLYTIVTGRHVTYNYAWKSHVQLFYNSMLNVFNNIFARDIGEIRHSPNETRFFVGFAQKFNISDLCTTMRLSTQKSLQIKLLWVFRK